MKLQKFQLISFKKASSEIYFFNDSNALCASFLIKVIDDFDLLSSLLVTVGKTGCQSPSVGASTFLLAYFGYFEVPYINCALGLIEPYF